MALPLVPIIAAVALVGLALAKGKSSTTPAHGASATPGIPSFPGAAGALTSAANAPPVVPPQIGPPMPTPVVTVGPPIFTVPPLPPPLPSGGTLPPITIIGNPVSAPPGGPSSGPPPMSSGDGSGGIVPVVPVTIEGPGGTLAATAPWDSGSMVLPDPSTLPALPAKYTKQSQESTDVQTSLNNWAGAVGFQTLDAAGNNLMPLATDGFYGPDTQLAAAGFQVWANATRNANLSVDGEAGPMTQTYLLDWGSITSGGY